MKCRERFELPVDELGQVSGRAPVLGVYRPGAYMKDALLKSIGQ